ncbi:hypothetical protein AVEN_120513-1 [Araneus ventricosus]|uniref:Uncharacterized protein n=1 Tax=Araneus ventricosus TaxID=182803 RepID=A0A4Y2MNW1_ARAVE|nr:hypothetical protein AVEN_120513-1 [Araneus ventricosus]
MAPALPPKDFTGVMGSTGVRCSQETQESWKLGLDVQGSLIVISPSLPETRHRKVDPDSVSTVITATNFCYSDTWATIIEKLARSAGRSSLLCRYEGWIQESQD